LDATPESAERTVNQTSTLACSAVLGDTGRYYITPRPIGCPSRVHAAGPPHGYCHGARRAFAECLITGEA